jgi:hypothetical protein
MPAMVMAFAILGDVAIGAGEDLTDEEGYIKETHRKAAKERISETMNSEDEAEVILESLGWG